MDEQLKKEIKKLIDDAILKARIHTAEVIIDMVNEQLSDNNVDANFSFDLADDGKGVWVKGTFGNDTLIFDRNPSLIVNLKEDE